MICAATKSVGEAPSVDALGAFRRYVTHFVNRHDFGALPAIMHPDYTLSTTGIEIAGRDGPYCSAVKQQFDQFPGLQFTIHELFVSGDSIGVRFTEHGASTRHAGAEAAWPSIAIYEARDGLLARCTIEQDYVLRRRQLAGEAPVRLDPPATAPWDHSVGAPCPDSERIVRAWLDSGAWLSDGYVLIDDANAAGDAKPVLEAGTVSIDVIISGRDRAGAIKVAFHARHDGRLAAAFVRGSESTEGTQAHLFMAGLVTVADGRVAGGHVIRDRLGLLRRLALQSAS